MRHRLPISHAPTWLLIAGLALSGCRTLKLDPTPGFATAMVDASSAAVGAYSSQDSLVQKWSYNAEAGFGPVTPLVVDNYVIVPTRRGEIHAVDRQSGKRLGVKKFGDAINGTPAIRRDVLMVPLDYGEKRSLKGWNLTSAAKEFEIRMPAVVTDILLDDSRAYVVDANSKLWCLSTNTGADVWIRALDETVPVLAAPVRVSDDAIAVVDSWGGGWLIRSSDGEVVRRFQVDGSVVNNIAYDGRRLIVPTMEGRLFAVSTSDGAVEVLYESTTEGVQLSSPVVADDKVVFAATDGIVRCFDLLEGRQVWQTDVEAPVTAIPLLAGRTVYIGTLGHSVLALRMNDGEIYWRTTVRGRIKSPMAFADDELFVLSEPRFLYSFGQGGSLAQRSK